MITESNPIEDLKNTLNSIPEEKCKAALEHVIREGREEELHTGEVVCVTHMICKDGDLNDHAMMFAASKAKNPNLKALIDPPKGV